jgi:hypothetical protein
MTDVTTLQQRLLDDLIVGGKADSTVAGGVHGGTALPVHPGHHLG